MKKGQTWISAVLYIALGTIIMTIILAAGMPVINKLKDKNVVIQTKEVMYGVDRAIRTVLSEGPGSQRTIHVDIGKGDFIIDGDKEQINWSMETKALLTAPDILIHEGNLNILTKETAVEEKYTIMLGIDYSDNADIQTGELEENIATTIKGRYSLIIKNTGVDFTDPDATKSRVSIKEMA